MENFNAVLEAVRVNNGVVVDDHGNGNGTLVLAGVAALVKDDGRVIPVALCDSRYFSLNRLYIDNDGKPHVSRESVAGCVIPMKHDGDLLKAIEGYNEEQKENQFSSGRLEHVTQITREPKVA